MNRLPATITKIESSENIAIIFLEVADTPLTSVVLEKTGPDSYLKVGNQVMTLFKETEVSISKDLKGSLSIRNRLKGPVSSVEKGELLSKIGIQFNQETIYSVITSKSCEEIGIEVGDQVEGLIKSNEIMLMKMPNDEK